MTGPKLTALILFGILSLLFAFLFVIGLTSAMTAMLTGLISAAATCTLIWFAETGKRAFARGFLALGAVFVFVPVAGLGAWGEQIADTALVALESAEGLSDDAASSLAITSILASAGLVFGMVFGAILILIGALMHRAPRTRDTRAS